MVAAALSRRGVLAAAAGLALLVQMAGAQSNMCYPKPSKRSPLKKGPCFMVSHTLPEFLDGDMVSTSKNSKFSEHCPHPP